jgi:uncharacterized protein (UPF0548 family)
VSLSYEQTGASLDEPMPQGFKHLRYETFIGYGEACMARAAEALLSFEMYRAMGIGAVLQPGPKAQVGGKVLVRLGFITAPCEFIWVAQDQHRAGFGYGTMPGHPACGEESFILTHGEQDRVWLEVRSFSRPARWYTRVAGPVLPVMQKEFARRAGRALRKLTRNS